MEMIHIGNIKSKAFPTEIVELGEAVNSLAIDGHFLYLCRLTPTANAVRNSGSISIAIE
jgi:hypothetical protein